MIRCIRAFGLTRNSKTVGKRFASNSSAIQSAMQLLGLDAERHVSAKTLRKAYLEAALRCHPDLQKNNNSAEFTKINDAYVLLQSGIVTVPGEDLGITTQDEASYRRACEEWLGLPAEVVEESKRCPMFRHWLSGKTDAADRWRVFFSLFGGLSPMLPSQSPMLEGSGDVGRVTPVVRRRKR